MYICMYLCYLPEDCHACFLGFLSSLSGWFVPLHPRLKVSLKCPRTPNDLARVVFPHSAKKMPVCCLPRRSYCCTHCKQFLGGCSRQGQLSGFPTRPGPHIRTLLSRILGAKRLSSTENIMVQIWDKNLPLKTVEPS